MTIVTAIYDKDEQVLRLAEPLVGVEHERTVRVIVEPEGNGRPWLALENTLSGDDAESFARAIDDLFPIER